MQTATFLSAHSQPSQQEGMRLIAGAKYLAIPPIFGVYSGDDRETPE